MKKISIMTFTFLMSLFMAVSCATMDDPDINNENDESIDSPESTAVDVNNVSSTKNNQKSVS